MKTRFIILLLGLAACAGCVTRYQVTLGNGTTYTSLGKPSYDRAKNLYTFKDASGQQVKISGLRVREIAPASMQSDATSNFKSTPSK